MHEQLSLLIIYSWQIVTWIGCLSLNLVEMGSPPSLYGCSTASSLSSSKTVFHQLLLKPPTIDSNGKSHPSICLLYKPSIQQTQSRLHCRVGSGLMRQCLASVNFPHYYKGGRLCKCDVDQEPYPWMKTTSKLPIHALLVQILSYRTAKFRGEHNSVRMQLLSHCHTVI